MKILLAIFSAHKYDYIDPQGLIKDWFTRPNVDRVSALRDTWLKDVTVDYKIFKGRRIGTPLTDEVWLDAPDDYFHSSQKLKALVRYALDQGYDALVKVDDDTFVLWDRFMANLPTSDYVGGGPSGFAAGCFYWLSRRAMEVVVQQPCFRWQEDFWVGCCLENAKIPLVKDPRYYIAPSTQTCQYIADADLYKPHQYISIHSLSPEQMRAYHSLRAEKEK
jgi:hypothetical protein